MGQHPIELEGLAKSYRSTTAVEDLSFTVPAGRVTGFLGPNGAGKSTTLHMLLGLTHPDRGEARIEGRRYVDLDDPGGTVGAVLDANAGHPRRTVRDHLRFIATLLGRSHDRVDAVLDDVGLASAAGRRFGACSLGMRQRLHLAAALLGEPRILVLDEPANGLDPAGIRWLRERLRAFADAGGAVLVSTHQLAELARSVDDLVIIGHGRQLAQGTLREMTRDRDLEEVYLDLTAPATAIR
jgi:ABC-2 type transport system ATP-binding protein